jgi:hypothetical protein
VGGGLVRLGWGTALALVLWLPCPGRADAAELYGWLVPPAAKVSLTLCQGKARVEGKETDVKGFYRFGNIPPGEYQLYVESTGCAGAARTIYVEPGVTRYDPKRR